MMTTNVFAIANVKQLRTYVVLEFYCLSFQTSWCVGVLNSAIFFLTFFTIGLSLARFFSGPSEFRGGFEHPKPPPWVRHWFLHYSRKVWPARKSLEPGIMNVENQPPVEPSKILLPSMHLKLVLMKNFAKSMNQEEAAFTYL